MKEVSKLDQPIVRYSPSRGTRSPNVWGIYEPDTGSIQYICADPNTKQAALIDVVRNFDPANCCTGTESMDQVLDLVSEKGLTVRWILDTHPHADHLMASSELKSRTGAPNGIGEKVKEIADIWRKIYNMPDVFDPGRDFENLYCDDDHFALGDLEMKVMLTPGHTPASITYVCEDAAFVADTFMQPDTGTSRADFPGGDTETLWNSLQKILQLPDETRLFVGHDYGSAGRNEPEWEATVAEHKAHNRHVGGAPDKNKYIKTRNERDETLSLPDRMLAALQVNLRAGQLPEAENDGNRYLKIPLNKL